MLRTDRRATPFQLWQLHRALFFGIFTMTPSVQSSTSWFFFHIPTKSGWGTCAANSPSESCTLRLSCPRPFPFSGSDGCHDFVFQCSHVRQYRDPVLLRQFLVVVCSELCWNARPILPPAQPPWWVAFPVFFHNRCVSGFAVLAADELGNLVDLPMFSPVGGLFCLTCQVVHVGSPVVPCNPLDCLVCFSLLLSLSLFQPLWSGVQEFLLQGSPAVNDLPGNCCDPHLPLLLSASQAGFAGLSIGYSDLLPHDVDVIRAWQCMFFSICQFSSLFSLL